jgi:hypothetical protein
MASEKKTRMVSLRMTESQYLYLNSMASKIKASTGFKITRASIILKLMEYGLPYLDSEFPDQEQDPHDELPGKFL